MEHGERKFVRMTLEELDGCGWKPPDQSNLLNRQEGIIPEESCTKEQYFPPDMQNIPHTKENAGSSSAVVLWRMVTPLIEALRLTNSQ